MAKKTNDQKKAIKAKILYRMQCFLIDHVAKSNEEGMPEMAMEMAAKIGKEIESLKD